jgi:transcriptional regulator CBF1
MSTPQNNKRKRGGAESGVSRPSPALRSGATPAQEDASELEHYDEGALSQLIAHNSGNHEHHQNGGESNATDTAAAALNHYQLGAATTAYETPSTGADDSSLSLNVNPGGSFSDAFLKAGPGPVDDIPSALRGAAKPPVGSEEWHKIRRDNHKEGKFPISIIYASCLIPAS